MDEREAQESGLWLKGDGRADLREGPAHYGDTTTSLIPRGLLHTTCIQLALGGSIGPQIFTCTSHMCY
jgi:hypothetical protein